MQGDDQIHIRVADPSDPPGIPIDRARARARTRTSDHGFYWFATPKLFSEMMFDSNYVLGCGFHPLA